VYAISVGQFSALVNSQNRKTKHGVSQTVQLMVLDDAEKNGKLIMSDASIDQVQAWFQRRRADIFVYMYVAA
jgi:hypothetical protein